ncbi:MAG: beta-phosphoglucomutase [Saprospiraceae bacterium]|nr:beta-phosphoglucomutase [Saprospiraceae bacterium]
MIKACIFDLDGVIVDTAKYHFIAWRQLANKLGFDFTKEYNEKLKGISRMDSLNLILSWGDVQKSDEEKVALATEKNEVYRSYILQMDKSEILPGVLPFLNDLRAQGIKMAIGSASKNAPTIIQQLDLAEYFPVIIDGSKVERSKPDPEVFLKAAAELQVQPSESIVFEDAEAGIEAAIAGGFYPVGVGDPSVLDQASVVIDGFVGLELEGLSARLLAATK